MTSAEVKNPQRRDMLQITIDVPEHLRDSAFEEELLQFRMRLRVNITEMRWLFRLALHEGSHLRYMRAAGQECTLLGPRVEYRDGEFCWIHGSVVSKREREYTYEFMLNTFKEFLVGALAVEILTGEANDESKEGDVQRACACLEMSRDEAACWLCVAEGELREELQNPVVVGEVLEAAREYARTIFGDDACVAWGVKIYRLDRHVRGTQES
jgi:hypothetical protein